MNKWIASKQNLPYDEIRTVYFKSLLNLDDKPDSFNIDISAHSRYKLYVNGNFICAGPCKGDAYNWYYDTLDIGEYLISGENCITVIVTAFPAIKNPNKRDHKGPDWSMDRPVPPCLYVSGYEFDWSCKVDESITPHFDQRSAWLGAMEGMQGNKALSNEEKFTTFNIESWDECNAIMSVKPDRYGIIPSLYPTPRIIPLPTLIHKDFTSQGGFTVSANTMVKKIYEADAEITAYFKLTTSGGKGSEIKITYAECFYEDEKHRKGVRNNRNGIFDGHADYYYPRGDDNEIYEPFLFRTFRFIQIEVTAKDEAITIYPPEYIITHYPTEPVTKPASGEPWVKKIWEMSLQTLKNCIHESFEDCPYYEQMQYIMDTRLQALFLYHTTGDTQLLKKAILDYRASLMPNGLIQSRYPCNDPQIIPQFTFHWIFMVNDYYRFTGDLEFVELCRPAVESILAYFNRKKINGLTANLEFWNMVDWAPEWSKNAGVPPSCFTGANTFHNMIYAYTLQITASLMNALGLCDLANKYTKEAESVYENLYEQCFDKEAGLFRESPDSDEFTQHSQIFAVLGGYGDADFRRSLIQKVYERNDLVACTFPLLYYLFRAFEETGFFHLTERYWDLWKGMIDVNLTTIPETPRQTRSDCHAWGALMLYEFPCKILGVNSCGIDCDSFTVQPKALYIKEISGTVLIPKGEIYVAYEIKDGNFNIKVINKTKISGKLILPDENATEIVIEAESEITEKCRKFIIG